MIVEELKKSILKYAITGKLSVSEKNDSNIYNIFEKIQVQRKELFEKKIITKQQYNIAKNTDRYKYEVPNNWLLTQIGYLGYVVGGGTPRTDIVEYWGNDYSWITPKDMKNYNSKYVDVGERSISKKGLDNSSAQLIPKGSVLCSSRAPIGYLGIASNELSTNQGFKTLVPLGNLNSEYIYYYLMSRVDDLKKSGDGTTFSEISGSDFAKFHIVLPPIEEQQRIVDKIEELFAKLEDLKLIEDELEVLKNNFPSNMRTSILQSAVSGHLTTQKINENINLIVKNIESKINKKIRCVANYPFDIPSNWVWIKFGDLVNFEIGKTPPRADNSYWNGEYNWVSISDMIENGTINETKEKVSNLANENIFKKKISKSGTLLMSFKLTVGRCSILNIDAFHNEGIISIYPNYDSEIIKNYLFKILPFIVRYGDTKGAIKGNTLNSKSLDNLMIPLPPIEEQQRIVDKLDQLLPLCDDIEKLIN